MWQRAGTRRLALPICEGELSKLREALQTQTLAEVVVETFTAKWCEDAWMYACFCACNWMYGHNGALAEGRWCKAERTVVAAIGSNVRRLLSHGLQQVPWCPNLEKELRARRVNYRGEKVGTCKKLTLAQVLPALPPKGHGGSINPVDFVSEHTKRLLINPAFSLLEEEGQELPRLRGIVHAEAGEINGIADELVDRGVFGWIPFDSVVTYRNTPVLNGLFGVEKDSTLPDGRPVLRLIMNLVGSNSIMRQFTGAVRNLSSITSWLSTVMDANDELRIWQSDMSNAFYLFKVPDPWMYFLAFNVTRDTTDPVTGKQVRQALACKVLPMGWLSSVSIMQEISENILHVRQISPSSQLVRNKPVPPWMVGVLTEAAQSGRNWWHVYLDNFAGGQCIQQPYEMGIGDQLHSLAEEAWRSAGVISSEKKRKSGVVLAQELGAFIDGEQGMIGGSPERFMKLFHATAWVIGQPLLSKKLVQVLAGRWIHVMQFRRPCMSFLDAVWKFINGKKLQQGIHHEVRGELFACLLGIPLMHTFLKAGIADVMTASDASGTGGAVGIARSLGAPGRDFVSSVKAGEMHSGEIPVLVVSLFGGIGGAFRTYDILGLRPIGLVHIDIHGPANRIVSRRWPHAEMFGDIKQFGVPQIKDLLAKYLGISEIHVWAGFPCTDLTSAKAFRAGLSGEASSLFFEVKRIYKELVQEVGGHIMIKRVVENVSSMPGSECETISHELQLFPYFLDCSDAVPMRRPRLCWSLEPLENCLEGIEIWDEGPWRRVQACADYPALSAWIEKGSHWPGGESGAILPTAMKAIARRRPPVKPAGIERCDIPTLQRYEADNFRFPPYQYSSQFIFYNSEGKWRTVSPSEKELLMGYGHKHTSLCFSASDIKKSPQTYWDERQSLLGNAFSIFSFIMPAAALCREFLPRVHYQHLCNRMGFSPGFRCNLRFVAPIQRKLQYGFQSFDSPGTVSELNRLLLARTNHTGSDVRIATGTILNPKAHPRQSVEADWWEWLPSFKVRWKIKQHINVLELRSILLAMQYHINHLGAYNMRVFHVTDSYVCMSIISKGRSGSVQMNRVLKRLNALLLAHGMYVVLGHVESTMNPTDGASREMATGR